VTSLALTEVSTKAGEAQAQAHMTWPTCKAKAPTSWISCALRRGGKERQVVAEPRDCPASSRERCAKQGHWSRRVLARAEAHQERLALDRLGSGVGRRDDQGGCHRKERYGRAPKGSWRGEASGVGHSDQANLIDAPGSPPPVLGSDFPAYFRRRRQIDHQGFPERAITRTHARVIRKYVKEILLPRLPESEPIEG
jgi:hypothetical protein